jgi:hypothetical protein
VQLSKEFNLAMPAVLDMENNPTTVVNLVMPSFINYDVILSTFVIKPVNPATDLGMFTVKGQVSDSKLEMDFSFKVETYNTPPHMKDKIPDITVLLGTPITYTLPSIEDEEGLPIKIQPSLPLPAFVDYDSPTKTFKFAANKTKEVGR